VFIFIDHFWNCAEREQSVFCRWSYVTKSLGSVQTLRRTQGVWSELFLFVPPQAEFSQNTSQLHQVMVNKRPVSWKSVAASKIWQWRYLRYSIKPVYWIFPNKRPSPNKRPLPFFAGSKPKLTPKHIFSQFDFRKTHKNKLELVWIPFVIFRDTKNPQNDRFGG